MRALGLSIGRLRSKLKFGRLICSKPLKIPVGDRWTLFNDGSTLLVPMGGYGRLPTCSSSSGNTFPGSQTLNDEALVIREQQQSKVRRRGGCACWARDDGADVDETRHFLHGAHCSHYPSSPSLHLLNGPGFLLSRQ